MLIPRFWDKTKGEAKDPDGKRYSLLIWGWSQENLADALSTAERRLREVVGRITRGDSGDYAYGRMPLREEIIRTVGEDQDAIITRNRYGALVLNTAKIPFIDIDTGPISSGVSKLMSFFRKAPADPALERIREACRTNGRYGYRLYRTRAGFRLMVTTAVLDPKSSSTEEFLKSFGSDPAFIKLCRIQGSFRARLTPKPWRIDRPLPKSQHPREAAAQVEFDRWLREYDSASERFATCQFVEAVGSPRPSSSALALVEVHDHLTKAESGLPLA